MKSVRLFRPLAAICFCMLIASGCAQINSSDSGILHAPPHMLPVEFRPIYKVDNSKKITAESNVNNLFWIFTWGSDDAFADNASIFSGMTSFWGKIFPFLAARETAAKAAFYKACKAGKCDSIVAARYEITYTDYLLFKRVNVQVSGFPAKVIRVEEVPNLPYYIDGNGKVVTLEKGVKPVLLFDARK